MSWRHNGVKVIYPNKSWTDDNGIHHPANWLLVWDESAKTANKVAWVDDEPASYDNRFYFSAGNPKKLADTDILDDDGVKIGTTPGLKTQWIEKKKVEANALLSKTDWYIVRNTESGTAIPSSVTTERSKIRTSCADLETKITDVADLDAFMALFEPKANGDPSDIDCYNYGGV